MLCSATEIEINYYFARYNYALMNILRNVKRMLKRTDLATSTILEPVPNRRVLRTIGLAPSNVIESSQSSDDKPISPNTFRTSDSCSAIRVSSVSIKLEYSIFYTYARPYMLCWKWIYSLILHSYKLIKQQPLSNMIKGEVAVWYSAIHS